MGRKRKVPTPAPRPHDIYMIAPSGREFVASVIEGKILERLGWQYKTEQEVQ